MRLLNVYCSGHNDSTYLQHGVGVWIVVGKVADVLCMWKHNSERERVARLLG